MDIKIIEPHKQNISKWSGGKTKEIYIYPENGNYKERNFKFRVSSATIDVETSTFTKLENVKRLITTLDNDLKLLHEDGVTVNLTPYEIYRFSGELEIKSFGKVTDFNLMLMGDTSGDISVLKGDEQNILISKTNMTQVFVLYTIDDNVVIKINDKSIVLKKYNAIVIRNDKFEQLTIALENKNNVKVLACSIEV
ncbi:HutD family protein [Clostridium senegalense]|uniref:HutD family protein n=1 Tax=Clostridium senegalense TaxID=1465809 RepID=UPI001C0F829E|nr:HutD family protein [Clostridium senegalense]